MKKNLTVICAIMLIYSYDIKAQSFFSLNGYRNFSGGVTSLFNTYENNPSNLSSIKDWGLSISYGGEFTPAVNSNLYIISLSKQIENHNLSVRYTPGYQKEFLISRAQSIILNDSTTQYVSSRFSYKELFGFGYSYKLSKEISGGLSLRYFTQEFNQEAVIPVFDTSGVFLLRENENEKINFWKTDLGVNYSPSKLFSFNIASVNLIDFSERAVSLENRDYEIRRRKNALLGITFSPYYQTELTLLYETSNSFQAGINKGLNDFELGLAAFHDKYRSPFISGFNFFLSYSSELYGISLSGIKYLDNSRGTVLLSDFQTNGINNILNNKYSYDRLVVTLSMALNTMAERMVDLIDVNITEEIFPSIPDHYVDIPFAYGRVVNISDKPVTVSPSSKINGLNDESIYSPKIIIQPKDTAEVAFFTLIPENYNKEKPEISYADFYLFSENQEPDAYQQKAVLINNINAWDGKVINLKSFIKKDMNYCMQVSKEILSRHKQELDTIQAELRTFYKTKVIFNEILKNLVYVSDPRASREYVQYPHQTVNLKGGDCDDLSVYFSGFLESIGIETALVDFRNSNDLRHVNIMVNTNLSPAQAGLITNNENKYFIRKSASGIDGIWIPIECTSLTDFMTAWNAGSEKFFNEAVNALGLAKGEISIIDVF